MDYDACMPADVQRAKPFLRFPCKGRIFSWPVDKQRGTGVPADPPHDRIRPAPSPVPGRIESLPLYLSTFLVMMSGAALYTTASCLPILPARYNASRLLSMLTIPSLAEEKMTESI